MSRPQLDSILSVDEWARLESDLFTGAGEFLTRLREYARNRQLPPVALVITACLRALSSLPGNVTFDAGVGPGSLNLFVALVGRPGQGKDRLISMTNQAITAVCGGHVLEPQQLALGSGEGVAEALQPDEGRTISNPVLFGASEMGEVDALMRRTGSTLRGNLLKIYSGNALGFTNRGEKFTVGAHTYTAGLWVGVQPDKAGGLLDGQDDGLRHRFIWTELVDPNLTAPEGDASKPNNYGNTDIELPPVDIPQVISEGKPFAFHADIVQETQAMMIKTLQYGVQGLHSGHRHQTRLKLAAGLALMRSTDTVAPDDWKRAGALVQYSERVQERCLAHLRGEREREATERLVQKERADEQVRADRVRRFRNKVLTELKNGDVNTRTALQQAVRGDQRPVMKEVLDSLEREGLIVTQEGAHNQKYVQRNPNYTGPWE